MLVKVYILEEKQKQMEMNEPWRHVEMKKHARPGAENFPQVNF